MTDICDVTVENTGETYRCAYDTALLDAALAAGIHMPHNCRGGACGTCKSEILEGEVDHGWGMSFAITGEEKEAGHCLACQSKPRSPRIRLRTHHAMAPRQAGEDVIVPAEIATEIVAAHPVTPMVLRLCVAVPPDVRFHYRAGMNMEFLLPGIEPARPYSIADAPSDDGSPPDGQMSFYITWHPHGLASGWLHEHARAGGPLTLRGPYGDFAFPQQHGGPVLALAGGTGLSPILAAVSHALAAGYSQPVRLLFSVRERRELFAADALARLARRHANFAWQATLTRETAQGAAVQGRYASGRIPALLAADKPDLSAAAVLIAGSPGFVDACAAAAQACGADPGRIVTDAFLPRSPMVVTA
jgi:CDP-4-dehydro-6-deoxyglucose reductase